MSQYIFSSYYGYIVYKAPFLRSFILLWWRTNASSARVCLLSSFSSLAAPGARRPDDALAPPRAGEGATERGVSRRVHGFSVRRNIRDTMAGIEEEVRPA